MASWNCLWNIYTTHSGWLTLISFQSNFCSNLCCILNQYEYTSCMFCIYLDFSSQLIKAISKQNNNWTEIFPVSIKKLTEMLTLHEKLLLYWTHTPRISTSVHALDCCRFHHPAPLSEEQGRRCCDFFLHCVITSVSCISGLEEMTGSQRKPQSLGNFYYSIFLCHPVQGFSNAVPMTGAVYGSHGPMFMLKSDDFRQHVMASCFCICTSGLPMFCLLAHSARFCV